MSIPHYGGPLGRAATLYRTEFAVTAAMQALGALFVRFKGVDYKAHVFVNGAYVGSHEGILRAVRVRLHRPARVRGRTCCWSRWRTTSSAG